MPLSNDASKLPVVSFSHGSSAGASWDRNMRWKRSIRSCATASAGTRASMSATMTASAFDSVSRCLVISRRLARKGAGIAVIPPILVRDELASGLLAEVATLEGMSELFLAVTLKRQFPNPLLSEVLKG